MGRLSSDSTQIDLFNIEGISRAKKGTDIIQAADAIQNNNQREFLLRFEFIFAHSIKFP
jgi:hypothetical protein